MRAPSDIGPAGFHDVERIARFAGCYVPPQNDPLTIRDLLPAVLASALGAFGLFAFLAGVGCLTGLACIAVGAL